MQYRLTEHSIRTTLAGLKEAPGGASPAQSRKHRILCVDDEIEGTRIRGEILVEQGYSVVLYHSPLAALRCDLSLIDLAIVGFQMPELNGRELLLRLRALGARFPVVMLTGAVDALSNEDRILFARCVDKGRSVQHLLDTIADFLDPNQIPDFGTRSLTHSQPAAFSKTRQLLMKNTFAIPETFLGVGYTKDRAGLPLEAVRVPVPQPGDDQVLIHVAASSLNPLEYKLADLNFFGRTPPVVLGLDLSGIVVAIGSAVRGISVGDSVAAMADLNGDGGWVAGGDGGEGGYALAREFLTVRKPLSLSFLYGAALPMCFLSAFAGLSGAVRAGDTVYVPGGGGGVGHLAVQKAARVLRAALVISSGSTPQSIALARQSGAHHVFDYKHDDIAAEIARLTGGRGVDLVFDATYSEAGFVQTAKTVRPGGSWAVLGVGPGKTTRLVETDSPVDSILTERGAKHINVNILRYFSEPAILDDTAKAFLQRGMTLAMKSAVQGLVVPHIARTIDSTVEAINAGLQSLKSGRSTLGKVAVIVNHNLSAGT
jgi:NADPH:quinone reductase-like Zn-dependent oxidoreductase